MTRDSLRWFQQQLEKLRQRVAGVVTRSTISAPNILGRRSVATAALQAAEERGNCEVWQPQGVDALPAAGDEALALAISGDRDNIALICVADAGSRPAGKVPGEQDFFGRQGQVIRCHLDGSISLFPGGAGVVVIGEQPAQGVPGVTVGEPFARSGDQVNAAGPLIAWIASVETRFATLGQPGTGPGPMIGNVQGTSTKARGV